MKRMVFSVFVLFVLLLFSACAITINIRFVDQAGEEISIMSSSAQNESEVHQAPSECETDVADTSALATALDGNTSETVEDIVPLETKTEETSAQRELFSKEDILAFYRRAVQRVHSGEAGYNRKTWESAQVLQLTGFPVIDDFVNTELNKRATAETDAETVFYEKGTVDAMAMFPDCTLTDAEQIVWATCEPHGENYTIKIVMRDEETPASQENSMLGQITDIILFKKELEKNLHDTLTSVTDYEYSMLYKGFEVTCELTKDGRFISLWHHAYAEVHVSTVRVLFLTIKDKDGVLIMDALFSDFVY